tara:strand:+ start:345 stop:554 length:210 start_codon:yes stop_codon:yes gene_type:complete
MKSNKLILLIITFFFITFYSYGEEVNQDCSTIKNLYKKMVCKANKASSGISSKKHLADYLPADLFKKKK